MTDDKKTQAEQQECVEILKAYTGHPHVKIVNRGNAAIFCALSIVKRMNPKPFILIPDQGGWISFRTYPKMLGFETKTVKTNRGLIDLIDLEKKAETGAALIYTSFAGYFAEQDTKYIYNICKEKGCVVIEDASGAVGDETLCKAANADIIVGSFGHWKVVDANYGGFISTANPEYFEAATEAFSMTNHYHNFTVLLKKLEKAPARIKKLMALAAKVKKELAKLNPKLKIMHPERRGLNVVVRFADDAEKNQILEYCERKKHAHVVCPNYTRLEEDAISIELKRE